MIAGRADGPGRTGSPGPVDDIGRLDAGDVRQHLRVIAGWRAQGMRPGRGVFLLARLLRDCPVVEADPVLRREVVDELYAGTLHDDPRPVFPSARR